MFNWLKRKRWLLVNAVLVGTLVFLLGIQVTSRSDTIDQSVQIGIGNEKVITLGHIAYAAGSVDYTYDGVDDDIQFQAALDALPATGGRLVDVSAVQKNFSATVTRAIANVVVEGSGFGSYFTNDGLTALFTAGGNGWAFNALRTDAGGIAMGATTSWLWLDVDDGSGTVYAVRTPDSYLPLDEGYMVVGGENVTRSATFTVASSTSSQRADYVCDGTDDQIEIQAAIDALPVNGGKVLLLEGLFILSTPLFPPAAGNVYRHYYVEGQGKTGTILQLADNSSCSVVEQGSGTGNLHLSNLWLNGNKANQSSGNGINATGMFVWLDDVTISHIKQDGIYCDGYTALGNLKGYDITIEICDGYGIQSVGSHNWMVDRLYIDNCSGDKALGLADCHEFKLSDVNIDTNSISGAAVVDLYDCTRNFFEFTYIGDNNGGGLRLSGATEGNVIIVGSCEDNNIDNQWATSNIMLSGANVKNNTLIVNCNGNPGTGQADWDIGFTSAPSGNIIIGRVSALGVADAGSSPNFTQENTLILGTSFVTANRGISLGTGAQQTIAHGLAFTPSYQDIGIFSDNTSASASVYMSAAPDATNIYVTCNVSGSRWHWATVGK